ncbi:leucine-rich repeat-containing protein 45 [Cephus cinctus]|uniref:Leucine-rich repeat-containing protein 45 n=1 Tax=Cephus cinctus TaxID=211228 RepID=A0AAJ7FGH3_CEPCN|nr:leucine-rich repeat-containing protein 45 [Cephus cinctus]
MKMLEDHVLFNQLCEKRGITPPAEVLESVKVGSSTGELQLSGLSIMIPVCEIISKMLASSSTIKSIDLSDCMLLSKGLTSILNALCEGSSVISLNLKGNNIYGSVVAQLGEVFIHNNTLKKLNIEWNSLGSDVDSFKKFCEGLSKNHNIEELDLRYNQISPHCADALSKSLKYNKSLKYLDLAWNTLGLQGGELIQNSLRENKTLLKLNLRGNCIPDEIMHSIEDRVYENRCRRAMSDSHVSKSVEIAKSLVFKENIKPVSLSDSDSAVQTKLKYLRRKKCRRKRRKDEKCKTSEAKSSPTENSSNVETKSDDSLLTLKLAVSNVTESNITGPMETLMNDQNLKMAEVNDKIRELNQMLQDRTTAINLLTNEIAIKAAEVDAARSQANQLETEVSQLKEERDKYTAEKAKEILELKRAHMESEEKWQVSYKNMEESYDKTLQSKKESDMKARRYEREIHKSTLEIASLKEKLVSTTQAYEDLISRGKTEMHRLRRELKEREGRHKIEINILKNSLKETTRALEECQAQLQKTRSELRETIENQSQLKARLIEMEHVNVRCSRSEESLQKVKEEKAALDEKLQDSQRIVQTLQRQVASLQSELIEPQRRYSLLKDELEQEKQKSGSLKQELAEERFRLKEQSVQLQKMTLQITALNTQINEIQTSHAEALRERDKERKQLKEMILHKERDLSDLKAEEVQRAGQLYAAFSKYLGSIGPNPLL